MESVVLCRYGELFLKSGNRRAFERVLADNVARRARRPAGARASSRRTAGCSCGSPPRRRRRGRRPADRACSAWCRSRWRARSRPSPISRRSTAMAIDAARAAVARDRPRVLQGRSAPRRQALPHELDGHRPSRRRARPGRRPACPSTCTRPRCASASRSAPASRYVFAGKQAAPGGLPVGASGRALLLLSGGIDSPVAGWLAAKRGLALDADLLPLAALHRREVTRQGAGAGPACSRAGRRCVR